jgi:hypothetical protein
VDLAGFHSGSLNRVLVNIQAAGVRQVTDAGTNLDRNQEALG